MSGTTGNDTFFGGSGADDVQFNDGDDLVYGGGGGDKLEGEGDDDTIYGGSGEDDIKGGEGDDTVFGGDDDDKIDGQQGNDTIFGGGGADEIKTDSGNDLVYAGSGADIVDAKNGFNIVYGGAGSDAIDLGSGGGIIYGGDGDEVIKGGSGNMSAYGGVGNDALEGGSGSDRFDGGTGDDTIKTGSGSDVIAFYDGAGNDVIEDFDETRDAIEIGSKGIDTFADIQARMVNLGGDTQVTLDDGSVIVIQGQEPGDFSSSNFIIVAPPVCFTPGTLIAVPGGQVPVEDLKVGDQVMTCDAGAQPILWIGKRDMEFRSTETRHKPIQIKQGALGNGLPRRTFAVSPLHRLLFWGPLVEDLFGVSEALGLSRGLVGLPGVRQMLGKRSVTYVTVLLQSHQVIFAEGSGAESFYPGPTALQHVTPAQRGEILAALPDLSDDPETGFGPRARRILTKRETVRLVEKMNEIRDIPEKTELPTNVVCINRKAYFVHD
ncbi:MAG: Hint domain-containing protein [Pseudomonadota bacterium]